MTTKDRLKQIVDELTDLEADDVLHVVEAHRAGEWWAQKPVELDLDAEQEAHLADVLEHPDRSLPGLQDLAGKAAGYRRA